MSTCKDCFHFNVCEAVKGRARRVGRHSLKVAEKHCPYNSFVDVKKIIFLQDLEFDRRNSNEQIH